ncbi:MAG: hypothetical protein SCARUB_04047 [Candidatus Scalindua rubra]|uniref:Uncharacterized protein n=1 Tax=Candidatus Scalindua rubra TaxID=1872076 RepID=A0A1E3X5E1_9BACT|nr:MAG: hypothetical protein SCARUB_04047 [Candidatus Scalindua rubra]
MLKKSKEIISQNIVAISTGLIAPLIIWVITRICVQIMPAIDELASSKILFPLLVVSMIANCILYALLVINNKKSKMIDRFSVKWDKDKNAHCPICDRHLINYGYHGLSEYKNFWCSICKEPRFLLDDGKYIELDHAKENLNI